MLKKLFAPKTKEGNNRMKKITGTLSVLGIAAASTTVEDLGALQSQLGTDIKLIIEALTALVGAISAVIYQLRENKCNSETI